MSYSAETPKALLDFLKTPIPHSYPQKAHVIDGNISATHSTYAQLEHPKTKFQRTSTIQDETVTRVAHIFANLPPANREKLLEDISLADPVILEASAALMLNHHVLTPVKVVLNLLWTAYLDNKIRAKVRTSDHRIFYLLRHFRYGFAIRAQHQDDSDRNMSRQDHILTFEPYRLQEDIHETVIRPAGSTSFCTDDEFNTLLEGIASSIGHARDNDRVFFGELRKKESIKELIRVQDLPRLAMTIIEEKKPGTLSPNAWQEAHNHIGLSKANTAEGNERKITAQILGYALCRNCPNFLISQFDVNVLLVVERAACDLLTSDEGKCYLQLCGTAEVTVDEDIEKRTPREKLLYMVFQRALKTIMRE